MEFIGRQELRAQLFLRVMTKGVLTERDYLLSYSVAEFYQEMSLFIEESEIRKRELDKLKQRKT